MTKEFVTKMIAAKRLEYEALQELLPDKLRNELEQINAGIKESLMDWIKESYFSPSPAAARQNEPPEPPTDKTDRHPREKCHKITIE